MNILQSYIQKTKDYLFRYRQQSLTPELAGCTRKFQNDFILKFRRFGQKFVFQINNYIIIIYLNLKGKLQKPISKMQSILKLARTIRIKRKLFLHAFYADSRFAGYWKSA